MDPSAVIHPLVEHWNGTRWLLATAPAITGLQSVLQGVDDLNPTNAWAVGVSGNGSGEINLNQQPLIEH
jgi:hypothetical protein